VVGTDLLSPLSKLDDVGDLSEAALPVLETGLRLLSLAGTLRVLVEPAECLCLIAGSIGEVFEESGLSG